MEVNNPDLQMRQRISALVDGECDPAELDVVLSHLAVPDQRADWVLYHQIGELLNSSEANPRISDDFLARFDARMATEPVHLGVPGKAAIAHPRYKFAYAVAAGAALLAVMIPQFAGHEGAETEAPYRTNQFVNVASTSRPSIVAVTSDAAGSASRVKNSASQATGGQQTMLRDPLLDSYLAAHQRYSRSMYSAVEYETGPITQESGK